MAGERKSSKHYSLEVPFSYILDRKGLVSKSSEQNFFQTQLKLCMEKNYFRVLK